MASSCVCVTDAHYANARRWSLFGSSEQTFDRVPKRLEVLRAAQHAKRFHLTVFGLGQTEKEHRRAIHSKRAPLRNILTDSTRETSTLKTRPKPRHLKSDAFRVFRQLFCVEGFLVGEQPRVHLPEFSLFRGTGGCFMGSKGQWMNTLDRKISKHVTDFASAHISLFDFRERITCMARAEGTLIVGELDQCDRRFRVPLEGRVRHGDETFWKSLGW